MRIGIGSWAYLRYGLEEGARRAREHGFDCLDYSNFIHTDTDFFNLPEIEFEKELRKQAVVYNEIAKGESYDKFVKRYNINNIEDLTDKIINKLEIYFLTSSMCLFFHFWHKKHNI